MNNRLLAAVSILLLIAITLFADEIIGKMYFDHLCSTKAGVKIYQVVELPEEFWDENGRARFYNPANGNFTLDNYRVEYAKGTYSSFFHIDHAGYARVNKSSGHVLGEVTTFRYWGGWLRRNFSPHNTANSCKRRSEYSHSLIQQIFKPKKN